MTDTAKFAHGSRITERFRRQSEPSQDEAEAMFTSTIQDPISATAQAFLKAWTSAEKAAMWSLRHPSTRTVHRTSGKRIQKTFHWQMSTKRCSSSCRSGRKRSRTNASHFRTSSETDPETTRSTDWHARCRSRGCQMKPYWQQSRTPTSNAVQSRCLTMRSSRSLAAHCVTKRGHSGSCEQGFPSTENRSLR